MSLGTIERVRIAAHAVSGSCKRKRNSNTIQMNPPARDHSDAAPPEQQATSFARCLGEAGVSRALAFLNNRTDHRYTGVYQFDRRLLKCLVLFDRENADSTTVADEILENTYCGLIHEFSTAFTTNDSLADERLSEHPARDVVRSFHGVPLVDLADRCVGALCHWDVRPRTLPAREMQLLFAVAPIVAHRLLHVRSSRQSVLTPQHADVPTPVEKPSARRSFFRLPRLPS